MSNNRMQQENVPEASDQKPGAGLDNQKITSVDPLLAKLSPEFSLAKLRKKKKRKIKEVKIESPEFVANTTKGKDQPRSPLDQQLRDLGSMSPLDQQMANDLSEIFQLIRLHGDQAILEGYLKLILGLLGVRSQYASLEEAEKNPQFKILYQFIFSDLNSLRTDYQNDIKNKLEKEAFLENKKQEIASRQRDFSDEKTVKAVKEREIQDIDEGIRLASMAAAFSHFPGKELEKIIFPPERIAWLKILNEYLTQLDLFQLPVDQSTLSNQQDSDQNQWLKNLNETILEKRTELQTALLSGSNLDLVKQLMSEIKRLVLIEKPQWKKVVDDYVKNIHSFKPDFKLALKPDEIQNQAREFFIYLNTSIQTKKSELQDALSLGKDLSQVKQLMFEIKELISVNAHGIDHIQKSLAYFSEKEKQFSGMITRLEAEQKYLSDKIGINPGQNKKHHALQKRISSVIEVYKKNLAKIQLNKNEILSNLILCDSGFLRIRVGINTKLKPLLSRDDATFPLKAAILTQINSFVANEKIKDGVEILNGITERYKNGISRLDGHVKEILAELESKSLEQVARIQELEEKKSELEKQKPAQVKTIQELKKQKAELEKQNPDQAKEIQDLIDLLMQVNKFQLEIDHLKKELIKALEEQNLGNQKPEQGEKIQHLIELLTIEKLFKEEFPLYNQALNNIRLLEVKPFELNMTDNNEEISSAIKVLNKDLAEIKKLHEEDKKIVSGIESGRAAISKLSNSPKLPVSSPVMRASQANSPQAKSPVWGATPQSKSSSPIMSVSPEEAAKAEKEMPAIREQNTKLQAENATRVFEENADKKIKLGLQTLALIANKVTEFNLLFDSELQSFSDVSNQIKTLHDSKSGLDKELLKFSERLHSTDLIDSIKEWERPIFFLGLDGLQKKMDTLSNQIDEQKNQYQKSIVEHKTVSVEYSNKIKQFSEVIDKVNKVSQAILVEHSKQEDLAKQTLEVDLHGSKQSLSLMNQSDDLSQLGLQARHESRKNQLADSLKLFQAEAQSSSQETLADYVSRIQKQTTVLDQEINTVKEIENRLNMQLMSLFSSHENVSNALKFSADSAGSVEQAVSDDSGKDIELSEDLLFGSGQYSLDEESDFESTAETSPSDQSYQDNAQAVNPELPSSPEIVKASEALEIAPQNPAKTEDSFQKQTISTKEMLDGARDRLFTLIKAHEAQVNAYQALKNKTQLYRDASETDKLTFIFNLEEAHHAQTVLTVLSENENRLTHSIDPQIKMISELAQSVSSDKINLDTYLNAKGKDFSSEYTQAKIQLITDVSQKQIELNNFIKSIQELIQREMSACSDFSGILKESNQFLATLDEMQTASDHFFVMQKTAIQALTFKQDGNLLAARSEFEKKSSEEYKLCEGFKFQLEKYYKTLSSQQIKTTVNFISDKIKSFESRIETRLSSVDSDSAKSIAETRGQAQVNQHKAELDALKGLSYIDSSDFEKLTAKDKALIGDVQKFTDGYLFLSEADKDSISNKNEIIVSSAQGLAELLSVTSIEKIDWNTSAEDLKKLKSGLKLLGVDVPDDFGCFISQLDMSVLKNEIKKYQEEIKAIQNKFREGLKNTSSSELEELNNFDLDLSSLKKAYREKLEPIFKADRQKRKLKLIVEGLQEDAQDNIPVNQFIEKMKSYGFVFNNKKHSEHFYLPQSEFLKIQTCIRGIGLAQDAKLILEKLGAAQKTMNQVINGYVSGLTQHSNAISESVKKSPSEKIDALLVKLKTLVSDANWETQIYALDDDRRIKLGGVEITLDNGTKFKAPKTVAAIKAKLDALASSGAQATNEEKIKILIEAGEIAAKASDCPTKKLGLFGVQVRTEITHQILKDLGSNLSKKNLDTMLGLNPNAADFDPIKNGEALDTRLAYLDKCMISIKPNVLTYDKNGNR